MCMAHKKCRCSLFERRFGGAHSEDIKVLRRADNLGHARTYRIFTTPPLAGNAQLATKQSRSAKKRKNNGQLLLTKRTAGKRKLGVCSPRRYRIRARPTSDYFAAK